VIAVIVFAGSTAAEAQLLRGLRSITARLDGASRRGLSGWRRRFLGVIRAINVTATHRVYIHYAFRVASVLVVVVVVVVTAAGVVGESRTAAAAAAAAAILRVFPVFGNHWNARVSSSEGALIKTSATPSSTRCVGPPSAAHQNNFVTS